MKYQLLSGGIAVTNNFTDPDGQLRHFDRVLPAVCGQFLTDLDYITEVSADYQAVDEREAVILTRNGNGEVQQLYRVVLQPDRRPAQIEIHSLTPEAGEYLERIVR